jgi:hypothetical protein
MQGLEFPDTLRWLPGMAADSIRVLNEVAPFAEVLAPVFAQGAKGRLREPSTLKELAKLAGVSTAGHAKVREAMGSACRAGVAKQGSEETTWKLTLPLEKCSELSWMLAGIALYRNKLHEDADRVSVVLSKPPAPSAFSTALEKSLAGDWGLQLTGDAFQRMAAAAERRFVVMTPFLDEEGRDRVVSLFEMTRPDVERLLIVRDTNAPEIAAVKERLEQLGVALFEFRLAKGKGLHETFHAKVVVADDNRCYVGSSNMTNWSFNYSLELGYYVEGQAAKRTAEIINAVIAVSVRKCDAVKGSTS